MFGTEKSKARPQPRNSTIPRIPLQSDPRLWHSAADLQRSDKSHEHQRDRELPASLAPSMDFSRIRLLAGAVPFFLLQRKPVLSSPADALEHEAEAMADAVTRDSTRPASVWPRTSMQPPGPQEGGWTTPQDGLHTGRAVDALTREGAPLSHSVRSYFEQRFGHDFSRVRVHSDGEAAEAAQTIGARAYTMGSHVAFARGEYSPQTQAGRHLLAHELAHVIQQGAVGNSSSASHSARISPAQPLIQRQPDKPEQAQKKPATAPAKPASGPYQQVYVVRDKQLQLGGRLVQDLEELKTKLMATKITGDWTLVLSMHGSEERLGAQSGPDWKKNAKFYQAADIEKLFGQDKKFAEWRDKYGPTNLSLVSCQVSMSFEGTLIRNLTRGTQSPRGLGEGCKPIATAQKLNDAPATRAAFDKLPETKRTSIIQQLDVLNKKWGYYGAPPVPTDQLLHYYYDEEPKGEWVQVEVMTGKSHNVKDLKSTGIPFWNRTFGPDAARFRQLCDQGVGKLNKEHKEVVPDVPGE